MRVLAQPGLLRAARSTITWVDRTDEGAAVGRRKGQLDEAFSDAAACAADSRRAGDECRGRDARPRRLEVNEGRRAADGGSRDGNRAVDPGRRRAYSDPELLLGRLEPGLDRERRWRRRGRQGVVLDPEPDEERRHDVGAAAEGDGDGRTFRE